jgi:carotenoid 1,2-hydratase
VAVPKGGYRWWYIDALSQDGQFGITVIAFIGSVFSPYYAWSGWADPYDHCAVNVALYSAKGGRWAMTERRRNALHQETHALSIGPSSLQWENGGLVIRFDEITAPIPSRLRGTIRLHPTAMVEDAFGIDARGRHLWRPIAPRADVEVTLDHPAANWRGQGYFDTNAGDEPLEDGFIAWDWSRAHLPRDTLIFYDVERRNGEAAGLALRIGSRGEIETIEAPPPHALPLPFWRMPRRVRGEASAAPTLRQTLEDSPFYTRSALIGVFDGEPAEIVHESLSLDRLRSPIVRAMLPFRMPRRFW